MNDARAHDQYQYNSLMVKQESETTVLMADDKNRQMQTT